MTISVHSTLSLGSFQQSPLQTAIKLAERYQRSIFPVKANKQTYLKAWKPYQSERPTVDQIIQWSHQFDPVAWAMVTGWISRLISLDFDGEIGRETLRRLGLNPHRSTGSGGLHVDFLYPGWHVKNFNHISSAKQPCAREYPGMDIRGDGGIVLVAGRNSKGPYEWLRDPGDLDNLDILPVDLREMLGLLHAPIDEKKSETKSVTKKNDVPSVDGTIIPIAGRALDTALQEAVTIGRDNACFLLACQLRDNNYSQMEAESVCMEFARRCGLTDQHGNIDPFTERMACQKVASAYSYPKRDPWEEKRSRKEEKSIAHTNSTPQISIEEHNALLEQAGMDIQESIKTHIQNRDDFILIEQVPPGVGKSRAASALGPQTKQPVGTFDIAWIAQRHNMIASVKDLRCYRHIEPCTENNCDYHALHNILGRKGYNTWSVHKIEKEMHGSFCDYANQFLKTGSAVYQLPHVRSSWPTQHEAIIIDEINPPDWLPERETTIEKMKADISRYAVDSIEDKFLRALQVLLASTEKSLQGKPIFDALDTRSHGHLTDWLGQLNHYGNTRYLVPIEDLDNPNLEQEILKKTDVLMPHLVKGFLAELVRWQHGEDWNSCIRIGPSTHGDTYALFITEPMQFQTGKDDKIPPIALLDATAHEGIHSRLLGMTVKTHRLDINPAPDTQHIAIRTGKRYGKTSLTTKLKDGSNSEGLNKVIKECRYMLEKIDPTGEQRKMQAVGIISFMGCVDALGEALDVPEHRRGHYWGIRGSNHLEDCSILLLIGTPMLRSDELLRQARAIYRNDPALIQQTDTAEYKRTGKHTDPRLEEYANYLTNSELTQAAHRIRPLRNMGRIIVSFCLGDIDYLPITETIYELPYMTEEGRNYYETRQSSTEEKIEKAYKELLKDGKRVTYSTLATLAKVSRRDVSKWVKDSPLFSASASSLAKYSTIGRNNNPITAIGTSILLANISEGVNVEKDVVNMQPTVDELSDIYWQIGNKYHYPEIAYLDLKGGIVGWNSFHIFHKLLIPSVISHFRHQLDSTSIV